jgi:hypothetical protein
MRHVHCLTTFDRSTVAARTFGNRATVATLAAGALVVSLSGSASATGDPNGTIRLGYAQANCLQNDTSTDRVHTATCNRKQNQAWLVS